MTEHAQICYLILPLMLEHYLLLYDTELYSIDIP